VAHLQHRLASVMTAHRYSGHYCMCAFNTDKAEMTCDSARYCQIYSQEVRVNVNIAIALSGINVATGPYAVTRQEGAFGNMVHLHIIAASPTGYLLRLLALSKIKSYLAHCTFRHHLTSYVWGYLCYYSRESDRVTLSCAPRLSRSVLSLLQIMHKENVS
jgi:hypothetical protein